ncbi:hypothetical protein IKF27_03055 [Candidatus Saccharibacteria bacterium]|nr:hypothetical protein [Candidatus Saccharibacteria bacterium]
MNLSKISGLGHYETQPEKDRTLYLKDGKAFFVERPHTFEIRTDQKLGKLLREKYESIMESRYFGKAGIEIVPSGQLTEDELIDLIRLSYNLTSS